MRTYPKSSVWGRRRANGRDDMQLRIPTRVAKVCRLRPGSRVTVEWRLYVRGKLKGFRAIIQSIAAILLLLFFAAGSFGQSLADNPIPHATVEVTKASVALVREYHFNKRVFFFEISVLGAAKSADYITTRQLLDRGGYETNPLFGPHPSVARQAGIGAGIFVAESAIVYLTERNHRKWVRIAGRAWNASLVAGQTQLAACNAGLDVKDGTGRRCSTHLLP